MPRRDVISFLVFLVAVAVRAITPTPGGNKLLASCKWENSAKTITPICRFNYMIDNWLNTVATYHCLTQ